MDLRVVPILMMTCRRCHPLIPSHLTHITRQTPPCIGQGPPLDILSCLVQWFPAFPTRLSPSSFGLSLFVFFTIFLPFFSSTSQAAQDYQHIPQGSRYQLVILEIQRPLLLPTNTPCPTTLQQYTLFGRYVPTPVRYRRLLTPLQILVVTVGLTTANTKQQANTGHAAFCFPNPPSLDVRSLPLPRMEFDWRKWNLQTHNDCTSLSHLLQPCTNAICIAVHLPDLYSPPERLRSRLLLHKVLRRLRLPPADRDDYSQAGTDVVTSAPRLRLPPTALLLPRLVI